MTPLAFYWAKLTHNEEKLAAFGIRHADLLAQLSGKSVALVGNARALGQTNLGAQIDSADIVIRINSAPMTTAATHGTRTDWLAISMPAPYEILTNRAPKIVLWMTPKRKRLARYLIEFASFYLNPQSRWQSLADRLGARPTTGLMMIDLLGASQAREINLYGFDFFTSLSLSGDRSAAQVPHDFANERDFVLDLMNRDARFKLHKMA